MWDRDFRWGVHVNHMSIVARRPIKTSQLVSVLPNMCSKLSLISILSLAVVHTQCFDFPNCIVLYCSWSFPLSTHVIPGVAKLPDVVCLISQIASLCYMVSRTLFGILWNTHDVWNSVIKRVNMLFLAIGFLHTEWIWFPTQGMIMNHQISQWQRRHLVWQHAIRGRPACNNRRRQKTAILRLNFTSFWESSCCPIT